MATKRRYDAAGAIGVGEVAQLIRRRLGWIFREQYADDVGIDAHVEPVLDGDPTGKLIALQIKSGESFFRSQAADYISYYEHRAKHLAYWNDHSLPVVLVLYSPLMGAAYWVRVHEQTVVSTGHGCSIRVPRSQLVNEASGDALLKIARDGEQVRLELSAMRDKVAELTERLNPFVCHRCDSPLIYSMPTDEDPERASHQDVYECGSTRIDGAPAAPCPKSEDFPPIDEFELECKALPSGQWHCRARPLTERARRLPDLFGLGSTAERAESQLRWRYNRQARRI